MSVEPTLTIRGFKIFKQFLGLDLQKELVADLREIVRDAPLFSPVTPYGKPMTVRMTSAGDFGWYSDANGYRYAPNHPNGQNWPAIPQRILSIWDQVSNADRHPECCLINFYGKDAKMGMHKDMDEADFAYPVVSLSLGDDAFFRIGELKRGGSTESIWLSSGDAVAIGGDARLNYHGIDRVKHGSTGLLPKGGRINVTLRVVT